MMICAYCYEKRCICEWYECAMCKKKIHSAITYEYRGQYSCEDCHDESIKDREFQRQEVIEDNDHRTKCFKGLDLGDNVIGKANREILKPQIEIASKESNLEKRYRNE